MQDLIQTKTFKDVHADLERESILLQKNHNLSDFSHKSNFLTLSGFSSSIATRMYRAIVEGAPHVETIRRKYNGLYKMILEPQLERVCDRYDLYVRNARAFIGDIPESNIREMMRFGIYTDDLPDRFSSQLDFIGSRIKTTNLEPIGGHFNMTGEEVEKKYRHLLNKPKLGLDELGFVCDLFRILNGIGFVASWPDIIQIAAVKKMFVDSAIADGDSHILSAQFESDSVYTVNMDPIVLCETKYGGRIIVTAWGDEANDELVANHAMN